MEPASHKETVLSSLSWRRCFHILYIFLIYPHSKDEDTARKEFIVNIILFGTTCFLSILEFMLLYQFFGNDSVKANASPYFFSTVYIVFVGFYVIARKGYFQIIAYLLVILYTLAATYAAWNWGPDLYQVVVSYALIITIAGIIINSQFSFITAIFSKNWLCPIPRSPFTKSFRLAKRCSPVAPMNA